MSAEQEFLDLVRRVRAGDPAAAAELVRLYEPAIRRAAHVRLADPRLRRLFDSMDICQSVFASFFVRAASGQYDLDRPERLLGLLVAMSRRKLADRARQEQAERRDYRRARPAGERAGELAAAGPGPSQEVATRELLAEFRRRLTHEERELADARALGQEWAQIAAEWDDRPEALRKKLARGIDRVAAELGLEGYGDE
jgi:RNA polymerase sigma-70 factor (ECF subfamily)